MKFTVVWKPAAELELAQAWEASQDRRAVSAAANVIDQQLARLPGHSGESREGDDRIIFERPLSVTYRVSVADRLVVVLYLRYTG